MFRLPRFWVLVVGLLSLLAFVLVACNTGAAPAPAATKKVDYPTKSVTFFAPSKPGSGFDATGRAITATLEKEKLVSVSMPVQNASGPPEGIATMVQQFKGSPDMIGVGSITLILNKVSGASPYGPKDLTLIANLLVTDYGVVVRADSPYQKLTDLLKDLKEQPEKTPLCGGQSDDRIAYGALAFKYGADLKKINYAAYSGGTEASTVLLEGTCKAEITTIDDIMGLIEGKKVRVLAVSGDKRLSGILAEVPTFKEAGVDLSWSNFRYVVGGPAMPDYAVQYWRETLTKMVKTTAWKEQMDKYRWRDAFLVDGFDKYMDEKIQLIDQVAGELGLKK